MSTERSRSPEDADENRAHARTAWLVLVFLAAAALLAGVGMWRQRAAPAPTAAGGCAVTAGAALQPSARRATVQVGGILVVAAVCDGAPRVVHYVVSAGPDEGVVGAVQAVRDGGRWVWGMDAVPPELRGAELRFWPWVDGRPAGEPAAVTIR